LKKAILLNVRGTREVMELAMSLKKIAAVMHVSTTYCNPDMHVIEEDVSTL
jgi:alcohol-forming fatty acyl-CoA reductase